MTDTTCQICQQRPPRDGGSVCGVCMGLEQPSESVSQATDHQPLAVCETCGTSFEPYKIGRNTVKNGICRDCVMRKKYGPDWVPGGNSKSRERRQIYNQRMKKRKKANGNGDAPDDARLALVTISFVGDDEPLFDRLETIAKKERRSMEQQVLYFLDRVIEK